MKQEPIVNPDPNNTDLKYWDKVLASHGLSMERARRSRIQLGPRGERQQVERLTYVGNSKDLVSMEEKQARIRVRGGRRVRPEGSEPDGFHDSDGGRH